LTQSFCLSVSNSHQKAEQLVDEEMQIKLNSFVQQPATATAEEEEGRLEFVDSRNRSPITLHFIHFGRAGDGM